ncbi:unnamed protein product [Ectocarpus sp. 8 AP-2014]
MMRLSLTPWSKELPAEGAGLLCLSCPPDVEESGDLYECSEDGDESHEEKNTRGEDARRPEDTTTGTHDRSRLPLVGLLLARIPRIRKGRRCHGHLLGRRCASRGRGHQGELDAHSRGPPKF